jgi:predicted RNA-binding Zn-ribbon protein involved in translation (DUF1610 family)
MRWIFKGKFSERIGKDYKYECDNCGNKIQVNDIFPSKDYPKETFIPFKVIGREAKEVWCPKCKEFERWAK